jgi:alpha-tubulin suppressor-like RCC1 family protein
MPTFYNFRENGLDYSFDDVFVPADLFREGTLWTWGDAVNGVLGIDSTIDKSIPVTTFSGGTNWKQVACGDNHVNAIKTDGTLWTWGDNTIGSGGQLGINSTGDRSTPVTTFAGGTNWKQVSTGSYHTAAIKTDGTLWTWGWGNRGQLGNNATTNRSTPVTTFAGGTNWKQVACAYGYTAAIKTDGTLWTWGRGYNGQLGIGDTINRSTPVTIFAGGTNWKQVDCGYSHAAAIKTDGTLWTWGENSSGQLGNNIGAPLSFNDSLVPITTFAGGTNWKQVSCGGAHTAAIKTDGTLWTWGRGYTLGNNQFINRSTPVTTFSGGTNWKQVSCGDSHVAAIKTDGTLWTWGDNLSGQLGDNDTSLYALTPVTTFAGGTNWKQASAGNNYTAALTYEDPVI